MGTKFSKRMAENAATKSTLTERARELHDDPCNAALLHAQRQAAEWLQKPENLQAIKASGKGDGVQTLAKVLVDLVKPRLGQLNPQKVELSGGLDSKTLVIHADDTETAEALEQSRKNRKKA